MIANQMQKSATFEPAQSRNIMNQLSTFFVGPYLFGVDAKLVQEIVRLRTITPVPQAGSRISGLINLRGEVIMAIDMRICLGIPRVSRSDGAINVVVRIDGEPTSLIVDEISAVVGIDGLTLEETPSTVEASVRPLILGAYAQADRLLLPVDVTHLLGTLDAAPPAAS